MKIIVGLGNPGEKYEGTRHNIGFNTLEHLLKKYEPLNNSTWEDNKKTKSQIKKVSINNIPALLAKPQTYMNNSGLAVSLLLQYFKVEPHDLIVINDELDLPLGKLQIRFGGGSAGHNGIESILSSLGTDKFMRIRMGIGHPHAKIINASRGDDVPGRQKTKLRHNDSVSNYVISHFTDTEHKDVRTMTKQVQKNLELILQHGIDNFMSKYNVKA
jgi:PTH1 family peptidyl-tRNA hydrolase